MSTTRPTLYGTPSNMIGSFYAQPAGGDGGSREDLQGQGQDQGVGMGMGQGQGQQPPPYVFANGGTRSGSPAKFVSGS